MCNLATLFSGPQNMSSLACLVLLFFFSSSLMLFQPNTIASALGNETDHFALLKFNESISNDPLGALASWNSSSNFCNWQGVTCGHRHQRVIELKLEGYRLEGSISPYVGNLSFLKIFSLASNNFYGHVPQELSRLFRLQVLGLTSNNLVGEFPISLTNCSKLWYLSLAYNHFTGQIPLEIGFLGKLERFYLVSNNISGQIPPPIWNLSSLIVLSFAYNKLEGNIPEEIGHLKNLANISLGVNELSGKLPSSLYNLSSLIGLTVSFNQFEGSLPSNMFFALPNLRIIEVEGNRLSGPIPNSITSAFGLQLVDFSTNYFVGKVPDLGSLKNLSILDLGGNDLGKKSFNDWEFIKSLTNCSKLEEFGMKYNNFAGHLPNEVLALPSLSILLNLSHNTLSGNLPSEVGMLVNIDTLDLSENHLSGGIPEAIGQCISLEYLYLQGNSFHVIIPLSLASLKGLRRLDLSRNKLFGTIPQVLQNISVLEYFNASFNMLEGEVPTNGVFRKASEVSLTNNGNLCGGVSDLRLPPCPLKAMQKRKCHKFWMTAVIVCSIGVPFLLSCILTVYLIRRLHRKTFTNSTVDKLPKISYQNLHNATNGFSTRNLIGTGSHGSVYKGILDLEKRTVAIKVLNLLKRGADKSFIAECNALKSVRHRNLVKILTCCSSIDYNGNDFKALVF